MRQLKIGVLGVSGHFLRKILLPLKQSNKLIVHAIASRNEQKAKEAANRYNIENYYSSYEELLNDKEIEAVYIPLPNHLHLEWIKKSVDAGKHVICEKPLTMNAEETEELIDYLVDKKVKVMEAFMYKFHPKWRKVKELVEYGEIGRVTSIHSSFIYNNENPNNIRNIKEYGGGALMDIGCYAISSARYITGEEPQRVMSLIEEHKDFGTDKLTSAILDFGGCRSLFTVSTASHPYQDVQIMGTGGVIRVIQPFNDISDIEGEIELKNSHGINIIKFEPANQYQLQFEAFSDAVLNDDDLEFSLKDSLENMKIIDSIKKSGKQGTWIDL